MAKKRRPPPPVHFVSPLKAAEAPPPPAPFPVDFWELATGVFILVAALTPASPLYPYARDIIFTTVVIEFVMAWLGVCAAQAESYRTRTARIAAVAVGALLVAALGVGQAIKLGVPGAVVPGLWTIATRLRVPKGVPAFDVRHCRTISYEAFAGWFGMLMMFVVLTIGHALTGGASAENESKNVMYAVAWGGFYTTLAFVMPVLRRKALEPRKAAPAKRR